MRSGRPVRSSSRTPATPTTSCSRPCRGLGPGLHVPVLKEDRVMATTAKLPVAAASHGLRLARPRGDAQVLRGHHRPAAGGHVVREGRAVRQGAHVLPLLLRPGRRRRAGLLPVRAAKEDQELFGPKMPSSPFHHIALNVDEETQAAIEKRLKAAGFQEPTVLRAGARLLPLGLRRRPERHDLRVHAATIRTSRRSMPGARRMRTASSSAGWPAITARTTCSAETSAAASCTD